MSNGYQQQAASQEQPVQGYKRSVPMLVIGIILTVFGGLGALGWLGSVRNGVLAVSANAAEAAGMLVGLLLFTGIPLVVGILLIVKSKRKV